MILVTFSIQIHFDRIKLKNKMFHNNVHYMIGGQRFKAHVKKLT